MPKIALHKVPTTNPAYTALVNNDAWVALRSNSWVSDGTTADAENHKAMTQTSQIAKIVKAIALSVIA